MDTTVFEKLPPGKLFFHCIIPSLVTMAVSALYNVADGFFVGRYIGSDALAAINIVMPVLMFVFAGADMIATGSSVHISILLGKKKVEKASAVFTFSVKLIFIGSCLIGISGIAFGEDFIRFLAPGASETAIEYAITYLKIHAYFAPFVPLFFALDNYLRICGKMKLCMWLNIISQVLNVLLDVVLIIWLNQGVWAAAFTNCIAMSLGTLVMLWMFTGGKLSLYYKNEKVSLKRFIRISFNGSSEFLNFVSFSIMSLILNVFLLKYGGTSALAAFSAVMYTDCIAGMLMHGMSSSLQPAISFCYGAQLNEKLKRLILYMLLAGGIFAVISFAALFWGGRFLLPVFIRREETELMQLALFCLKLFSYSYFFGWIDSCFSSCFTSLELPMRSLLLSLFGALIFPVVFLFILAPVWHLKGVFLMPFYASAASAVLATGLALTLKWSNIYKRNAVIEE